jgi:hypothetical protein
MIILIHTRDCTNPSLSETLRVTSLFAREGIPFQRNAAEPSSLREFLFAPVVRHFRFSGKFSQKARKRRETQASNFDDLCDLEMCLGGPPPCSC